MEQEIPNRLYKYRAFSDRTVQMLVSDELFFADPSTFNDPLDSQPCLDADLDNEGLERLWDVLVEQRQEAEKKAAVTGQISESPEPKDYQPKKRVPSTGEAVEGAFKKWLSERIERELIGRYEAGVFCVAEHDDCSLMWSHYGDQHKGICFGYSVPEDALNVVRRVEYDKDRLVKATDVAAMLAGDNVAKQRVDDAVLLRKAPDWAYEKEWRLIGNQGLTPSPFKLEKVIFGLRCSYEVMFSVTATMQKSTPKVTFYEMRQSRPSFKLVKHKLPIDDMDVEALRDYFFERSS